MYFAQRRPLSFPAAVGPSLGDVGDVLGKYGPKPEALNRHSDDDRYAPNPQHRELSFPTEHGSWISWSPTV